MAAGLKALQERLGHAFGNEALLLEALTHASHGQSRNSTDNERLEFLGDRVLGLLVAERLINDYPDAAEGALARRLNALVRKETCGLVAEKLGLAAFMRVGPSERGKEGGVAPALLANACEAVLGALYMDGGLQAVIPVFDRVWIPLFEAVEIEPRDPKSSLQEWAQGQGLPLPIYAVIERSGPDHAPHFVIEVSVEGHGCAHGEGASKRQAEQTAATTLLKQKGIWAT
ncbi:MAG: ribonuclease III [Alphaproteobacteria bacterium]